MSHKWTPTTDAIEDQLDEMQSGIEDFILNHPLYIRDEDNEEDDTYCSFYFKFPTDEAFLNFIEKVKEQ